MGDKELAGAIREAVTFPVLTEEVTFPTPSPARGPGGGGSGSAALGQVVDQAIRSVLGWRWRPGDARGFVAALNQSFTPAPADGHTEWRWTPKSYAAQVQAELGALTGAQASLYQRARVALDQSLPLLDGLYPLLPAADPEDVAAIRAIVRSEMTGLVTELGMTGGPRVQRVDDYFALLGGLPWTGPPAPTTTFETVAGNLGVLRDRFGLTRDQVNTVDEEQDLTNFLILVDYFDTLHASWSGVRDAFTGQPDGQAFLGTQLVLLSRQLAVLGESVQQVYFAMDSVWLGPAERATIRVEDEDGAAIMVADLLQWIESFAGEEGVRLLEDGGMQGVIAFAETLERLLSLVGRARDLADGTGAEERS